MPTLDELVSEVNLPGGATMPSDTTVTGLVPRQKILGSQQLRLHVPNPRTEVRLGQSTSANEAPGLHAFTEKDAWVRAHGDVSMVAGEEHPTPEHNFAADVLSEINKGQALTSVTLQLMKMMLAPGTFQAAGTLALAGMATAGAIEKLIPSQGDPGKLILAGKRAAVLASDDRTSVSSTSSTVVWAGTTLTTGANGAVSIDGGMAVSIGAGGFITAVAGIRYKMVAGNELELACRRGTTSIRGRMIDIGIMGGNWHMPAPMRPQRPTTHVMVFAQNSVHTTVGGRDGDTKLWLLPSMTMLNSRSVDVKAELVKISAGTNTVMRMHQSEVRIAVAPTLKAIDDASKAAHAAHKKSVSELNDVRNNVNMNTSRRQSGWFTVVWAAEKTFQAQKKIEDEALEKALKAIEELSPTFAIKNDGIGFSVGPKTSIKLTQTALQIEGGGGSIKMGANGITLKFGKNKLTIGPGGIIAKTVSGAITQKAAIVNNN